MSDSAEWIGLIVRVGPNAYYAERDDSGGHWNDDDIDLLALVPGWQADGRTWGIGQGVDTDEADIAFDEEQQVFVGAELTETVKPARPAKTREPELQPALF